jgi:hypothetical protein
VSTFDEKPPFKKRIVSASLTEEQRREFDQMKTRLRIGSDGALIKRALADLSRAVLTPPEDDFGDASIQKRMQELKTQGVDLYTIPNVSRLRPAAGDGDA